MAERNNTSDGAKESLNQITAETKIWLYDRMTDTGGFSDNTVDDCVREVVREMRSVHDIEYNAHTRVLVDAAYNAAAEAMQARKENHVPDIVAKIDNEE